MTRGKWRIGALALVLVAGALSLAPVLAADPLPQDFSHRAWQRANGEAPGVWTRQHTLTHEAPSNPPTNWTGTNNADCQSACHWVPGRPEGWKKIDALRNEITSPGFTNLFGVTPTYVGNQYPWDLLTNAENQTKHALAFRDQTAGNDVGCGSCHSAKAALDRGLTIEEEWNETKKKWVVKSGGITGCANCHAFAFGKTVADPAVGNLHATHVTFVQAEMGLADATGIGDTACRYCHAGLGLEADKSNAKGSCWNCHLSGHWPKVPYWSIAPE
ncbi:MAG: hypothetical protein HY775_11005 [Acidobacteria bacterium]|nr:hypothetical protein [Acidobacteriota bacterium]